LSRIIGASVRLLLVANVLQDLLFDDWNIAFEWTVIISVLLIWVYTNRGGIKTIVWTDTLQTTFMLASVILTFYIIGDLITAESTVGVVEAISSSDYSQIFFFDDINSSNHFLKHFLGGIFITIGMTGLDQDMMQKNLTCKNSKESQKNMMTMASLLVVVNLVFLSLGALLYLFAEMHPEMNVLGGGTDLLFSNVVFSEGMGIPIGLLFLLGLIAAAYSSADSALTSLTTSFSIDFLNIKKSELSNKRKEQKRKVVHVFMSIVVILTVILLKRITEMADENSDVSAISLLMKCAGFTYGPLIGMFFFGIFTKRIVKDKMLVLCCFLAMFITFLMWFYSTGAPGVAKGELGMFGEYKFGFELIVVNALISFLLIALISKKQQKKT